MKPTILLFAGDLTHRFAFDVLGGIDEACRADQWRILLAEDGPIPEVDGAIGFPMAHTRYVQNWAAELTAQSIPIVQFGIDILIDEHEVGQLAARHFRQRGLVNAAIVNFSAMMAVGRSRCEGFATGWNDHCPLLELPIADPPDQIKRLIPWLLSLKLPIGIFTPNDYVGAMVADACVAAQVSIPEQCAIIGADNDVSLCLSAPSQLSSVRMPHSAMGAAAVARLRGLLAGHAQNQRMTLHPGPICARASTDIWHCSDPLVVQALEWIHGHFADPHGVESIAEAVGLNRRTLERKFRSSLGRTIHDELRRARITRAQQLLTNDASLTLSAVAKAVGLSTRAFAEAFVLTTGCPPGEWRTGRFKG